MNPERGKTSGAKGAATEERSFYDLLIPLLAALGTGIGTLGFVIFFGGFILWTRFDAAGLPANEAVAQVPRSDLVATGASFLVPAVLAALIPAALAVTSWDFAVGSPKRGRRKEAKGNRRRATESAGRLEDEMTKLNEEMQECRARAAEQKRLGDKAPPESQGREGAYKAQKIAEEEAGKCEQRLLETREEVSVLLAEKEKAEETIEERSTPKAERALQVLLGVIPMVAALAIAVFQGWSGLFDPYSWLLVLAAGLTLLAALVVANMTDHFAWYMLCVFVGVGITIAVSNYARTQNHVNVSPVAALNGPSPVIGFFVAETGDAVYVGRPQPAGPEVDANSMGFDIQRSTVVRVPKASLTSLTIGPLMDEDKAYRRSLQLAMALCRRAGAAAAETTKTLKTPAKTAKRKQKAQAGGARFPAVVPCSENEEKLLVNRLQRAP